MNPYNNYNHNGMGRFDEIVKMRDLPQYADKQDAQILEKYGDYKVFNSLYFHPDTPDDLVKLLEGWNRSRVRLTFDFGDTETGVSWNEVWDISGYVGRTTGIIHSPILVHNQRSMGGGILSTNRILTIRPSNKKDGDYFLYQAPVLKTLAKSA